MRGKKVLLTGGTGGLGLGVTPLIIAQGADVTIPYRQPQDMERLKGIIAPADLARIQFINTNLEDETSVEELINRMGKVDILIHLVGGFDMGATHEYSFNSWKKQIDLNLNTTFLTCKYSLGKMLENGYGRMITIGSRGGIDPAANLAAYSAAKAGVIALTKAIAQETKGKNITANTIIPSIIDTPTNRQDMGVKNADQWVKPESIGQVICFLLSDAAKDISGAVIPVYGNV